MIPVNFFSAKFSEIYAIEFAFYVELVTYQKRFILRVIIILVGFALVNVYHD